MQPIQIKPLWLTELAQAFNNPIDLLQFLELNPNDFEGDIAARKLFALRVPRMFAEKWKRVTQTIRFFASNVFTGGIY